MIRILASRRFRTVVSGAILLTFASLIGQGCGGPDMGPPPDQTVKNNPPDPTKDSSLKTSRGPGGGTMKKPGR